VLSPFPLAAENEPKYLSESTKSFVSIVIVSTVVLI
jgi:hypothetical protein